MDDTYVIMPVYNEASVVGRVIGEVRQHFGQVICVDDGSRDGSEAAIIEAGGTLVQHPINLGAGAATQTGLDFALQDPQARYFITIDSDGQHQIDDAIKMRQYLIDHKLDVVFGSRFLGQTRNMTGPKGLLLKLARLFSESTSGVKLSDPHIGLRVFGRRFAENLKITLPDFAHASEVVHRIAEGRYRYAEVPVTITYSEYSKAKGQPMSNSINIVFDLLLNRIAKK